MSTEIEDVESQDQVGDRVAIENSEARCIASASVRCVDEIPSDIEEIHTQALSTDPSVTVTSNTSCRPRNVTNWLDRRSGSAADGQPFDTGHQQRAKINETIWRLPRRSSTDLSRPFADLPRQLTEALARFQSTRSMQNSLTTSTIYATYVRTLQLKATSIIHSCGNVYVEANDDSGEKYVVHLPTGAPALRPHERFLLNEPYSRRKFRNLWLLSLVISIRVIR